MQDGAYSSGTIWNCRCGRSYKKPVVTVDWLNEARAERDEARAERDRYRAALEQLRADVLARQPEHPMRAWRYSRGALEERVGALTVDASRTREQP